MVILGVNGLLEIAGANGLASYSTVVGPGADGLTYAVTLVWEDGHQVVEIVSENDSAIITPKSAKVWKDWPDRMLRSFAINKAIRKYFKDAVEYAERCIDRSLE